mmetsp:Transcript_2430/g.5090  ORF Transcript_2430/g.5090 Transcript_2430/m.5090 type:complete len:307 (-) Transcript_2430:179-1099(-)
MALHQLVLGLLAPAPYWIPRAHMQMQLSEGAPSPPLVDLKRSLLAARACSLAFVPPAAIVREPYSKGLTCVAQVEGSASQAGATLFSTMSDNGERSVLIACRGSASARNFRTNLNIGPVRLSAGLSELHPSACVHDGFQQAGVELWDGIKPHMRTFGGGRRVLLTGHSLGGGTAAILALHLAAAGWEPDLITVAGPRLGDAAFAQHYRETCPPAFHLVHDDDDVLKSNTKLWDDLGFQHVGQVVRCSKEAPCIYTEGDEACLGGQAEQPAFTGPPSLKGVFVDHCRYMGVYIGVRLEHPGVWLRPP